MASRWGKCLIRYESQREAIAEYLTTYVPISHFWIAGGLVSYLDATGQAFVLMDDNEDRVEACIAFLEEAGAAVLTDSSEVEAHIATLLHQSHP